MDIFSLIISNHVTKTEEMRAWDTVKCDFKLCCVLSASALKTVNSSVKCKYEIFA